MLCIWASLFFAIAAGVCWLAYLAIGDSAPAWLHTALPIAAVASVIAAGVLLARCKLAEGTGGATAARGPDASQSGAAGRRDAP